ncbi:hypothetical protein A2U01_0034787, partial [Trifolium medium]|nr:hypothetical protein [Trifolium medium]
MDDDGDMAEMYFRENQ